MASRSDYRLLFRNCGKLFCSCSLRSSAIALGWLGIIGNVSQMMMHLMYSERKVVWRLDLLNSMRFNLFIFCVALGAILTDSMLLFGIHKKKPSYMLPFLIMDLTGLILVALTVAMFGYGMNVEFMVKFWPGMLESSTLFFLYSAAFWMVMYKYYKELREHVTPQYGTHFISYNGHEHN